MAKEVSAPSSAGNCRSLRSDTECGRRRAQENKQPKPFAIELEQDIAKILSYGMLKPGRPGEKISDGHKITEAVVLFWAKDLNNIRKSRWNFHVCVNFGR